MSRSVSITVKKETTDEILRELSKVPGITGIQVQRGISLNPPGDVIVVQTPNRYQSELMRFVAGKGIGKSPGSSIIINEPKALISPDSQSVITNDVSIVSWEEMDIVLAKESNMTLNGVLLMAIAGIMATAGIVSNTLHFVIAAMLIAPGFEPIARIGLGLACSSQGWKRGVIHSAIGYLALLTGAALVSVALRLVGSFPVLPSSGYEPVGSLVQFWTNSTFSGIVVSVVAAIGGALLIESDRSVLTSGTMIGLSLIPSAAMISVGLVSLDFSLALQALVRFAIDFGIVLLAAFAVFLWKRKMTHKRKSML